MLQITSRLKGRNGRTRKEWLDGEKLLLGLRMEGNPSVAQIRNGATRLVLTRNNTCRSHVMFPQVLALAHRYDQGRKCGKKPRGVGRLHKGVGIHLGTQNQKGI